MRKEKTEEKSDFAEQVLDVQAEIEAQPEKVVTEPKEVEVDMREISIPAFIAASKRSVKFSENETGHIQVSLDLTQTSTELLVHRMLAQIMVDFNKHAKSDKGWTLETLPDRITLRPEEFVSVGRQPKVVTTEKSVEVISNNPDKLSEAQILALEEVLALRKKQLGLA